MKKSVAIFLSIAVVALLLGACAKQQNTLPDCMSVLKENGYLIEFSDKSDTRGGMTLHVNSIASDGMTTYVAISADGTLPQLADSELETLYDTGEYLSEQGGVRATGIASFNFAERYIVAAKLSDSDGHEWNYTLQYMLNGTSAPTPVVRPVEHIKNSGENEVVLVFYNTELSGPADFALTFEIRGIDETFAINGLQCKIGPVQTRDLRGNELLYHAPYATMQLVSMTNSLLGTAITIEWNIQPDFTSNVKFYEDEHIVIDWGEASTGTFMFTPTAWPLSQNENTVELRTYTVPEVIPLDKEIHIYAFNWPSQSKSADMFVIPAQ